MSSDNNRITLEKNIKMYEDALIDLERVKKNYGKIGVKSSIPQH